MSRDQRPRGFALGLALCLALAGLLILPAILPGVAQAAGKTPPSCAAISFRPVVSGLPDGDQDAGLYKSRFGKIELKAQVKTGEAQDYFMLFNGKRPEALKGQPSKAAEACAKAKTAKSMGKPLAGACIGGRFRVVIAHDGGAKTAMLFALQDKEWRRCAAARL